MTVQHKKGRSVQHESRHEESPAEYNAGGYLAVKIGDKFNNGRYTVLRKLGYVHHYFVYATEL